MSKKLLLLLCLSSANPFKPLSCLFPSMLWRVCSIGCGAYGGFCNVSWYSVIGDGDWVWNGAGQLQGIWTGLMDPFETRRGQDHRGSPQGHVYSEPYRACRMPSRFYPDWASAAPHLDAIGVRRWGNLAIRLLEENFKFTKKSVLSKRWKFASFCKL